MWKKTSAVLFKGKHYGCPLRITQSGIWAALKYSAFIEFFPRMKSFRRFWWTLHILHRSEIVQGLKGRAGNIISVVVGLWFRQNRRRYPLKKASLSWLHFTLSKYNLPRVLSLNICWIENSCQCLQLSQLYHNILY